MSKRKIFVASLVLFVLSASCKENPNKEQTPQPSLELEAARELTQKAFRLKKDGNNAQALELFEEARKKLELAPKDQKAAIALASNLDDFGTIYLRTGDYDKAKKHYEKAREVLQPHAEEAPRLAMGIDFRLTTLKAFQTQKIRCAEPLQASNAKTSDLPYLPDVRPAQAVFEKINAHLQGCRGGDPSVINVRMVVTGDGRIALAEPLGPIASTEAGRCIKQRILEAFEKYIGEMPHFTACYRPFTYPFVVGDEEAWKNRTR